jgi:urease accessory protein
MLRAIAVRSASKKTNHETAPTFGTAVLQHDERHLRRKAINLTNGTKVLADFPEPVILMAGDELVLDNGSVVIIVASDEPLYEITAHNNVHLARLAWHIGNRHLPAAIATDRILILRDHVIKTMLVGLGATVHEITAPFNPMRGAYTGHELGHQHGYGHLRDDHHGHDRPHHHHHHDD